MVKALPRHADTRASRCIAPWQPLVLLGALCAGCGPDAAGSTDPSHPAAASSTTGAGDPQREQAPAKHAPLTTQDEPNAKPVAPSPQGEPNAKRAPLAPKDVIDRVIHVCHGGLAGREDMANSAVLLRRTANDDTPETVILGSDDCMRVTLRDLTKKLLFNGHAWHIFPHATPVRIEELKDEDKAKLARFQTLIRAALLAPLYSYEKVTRQGPGIYALIMKGGATWRLQLHEVVTRDGVEAMLPRTLSGPAGEVTFEEHLHTGPTNLPKKVLLGEFGRRWFSLENSGLVFNPNVFANPGLEPQKSERVVVPDGFVPSPPIDKPVVTTVRPKMALVLDDPGTWKKRVALLLESGAELQSQGQQAADLDFLFTEGGRPKLAMPFEMRAVEQGGRPFVRRKHQRILSLPAHRAVLVYPKNGTVEDCTKRARELVDAFVKKEKLIPDGAPRVIPWIAVDEGVPSERELRHLRVGFELPVREQ